MVLNLNNTATLDKKKKIHKKNNALKMTQKLQNSPTWNLDYHSELTLNHFVEPKFLFKNLG